MRNGTDTLPFAFTIEPFIYRINGLDDTSFDSGNKISVYTNCSWSICCCEASIVAPCATLQTGVDYEGPGITIRTIQISTPATCVRACLNTATCQFATFYSNDKTCDAVPCVVQWLTAVWPLSIHTRCKLHQQVAVLKNILCFIWRSHLKHVALAHAGAQRRPPVLLFSNFN